MMNTLRILLVSLYISAFATTAFALPKIEEWNTKEGARVLYIHAPELPMVDIRIALDAGSFREETQFGLASMTASLMTLGTTKSDENSFAEQLESLGSSLSMSASITTSIISLRSLTEAPILDKTLALLEEMITTPRFDEKIFIREQAQGIDAQKARLDRPASIASETYLNALYPDSIQGVTSEMLKEALGKLTIQSAKDFRQRFYHATNAKIAIIGDIDQARAAQISQKISQLLGKGSTLPKISDQLADIKSVTLKKPFDSPQSTVLLGHPSINRFDPDFFPLMLGNHVLGGSGLTSLLMMDIREKQGLTYGISSDFSPSFLHGPFTINLSTKNESVDHAITATTQLIEKFIAEGPTDDELLRAKNNLVGSVILDLSSNGKLASALLFLAIYDLPLDYYDAYPAKIKAITKEEIIAAFKKHVHPEKFITVIVGDK